jgi:hypothetical protein
MRFFDRLRQGGGPRSVRFGKLLAGRQHLEADQEKARAAEQLGCRPSIIRRMMINHRSDLIAFVIDDGQSSIRAHAKAFAIQLPANRERLRAFWRMLYESRRTRAFTHSRMARARFNADRWPSAFDESIPPDAGVGVTRQGPIARSSASFLTCPTEVRLGSIAPLANPSANDRYLRKPAVRFAPSNGLSILCPPSSVRVMVWTSPARHLAQGRAVPRWLSSKNNI